MNKLRIIFVILVSSFCLAGPVYAKGPTSHQLGPTGLQGSISKNTVNVTKVDKGSPADGKIKVGDQVIGAGVVKFKKDVRRELAEAIDAAETEKGGGKLALILKGNKKVNLQLKVLGSYSSTAPYNCPKSEAIIKRAADYLVNSGKASAGCLNAGVLGLMATGEQKYIDAAGKIIRSAKWSKPDQNAINDLLKGEKDMGYVGWYWGYNLITLSEYHLLTGDKSVLPAIKTYAVALAKGQDAGGIWGHRMATDKRNGRLPGYAQINQPSLTCFMGMVLAQKCGIKDPVLDRGVERTHAFYASFIGRGAFNYGVHGPNTRTYNNNGTTATGALCMSIKGNKEGAKFFSHLSATSYDGLETGHATYWFNVAWTPLGANISGPEVTQQFFKKSRWLQTMYRRWDGGFSFDADDKPKMGDQSGVALLAYCLPRRALYITGKNADKSLWLKGQDATDVINLSKIDYKSKSTAELLKLINHPIPHVRRGSSWQLYNQRKELTSTFIKLMQNGTRYEKEAAIGAFGYKCPPELQPPVMDHIGLVLRNRNEDLWVRAAAAGALCWFGKPAYKYYGDMVKFVAEDKPSDPFGDIDWAVGQSLDMLCKTPFTDGLVNDKKLHYKVALKLANNKRQHVRAFGLRMLTDMPLEDFYIVADTVMHVIKDKDPTYHSYHSPGGPIGAGVTILANLNIKEGIQQTVDVLDMESGKWAFKLRMVLSTLPKYGGNARSALQKLKADPRLKTIEKGRFAGSWKAMVKAIEEDKNPRKLMTFEEAKRFGMKKRR